MAKTMTTSAPTTRRLRFLESVTDDRWQYVKDQVADVPAAIADELVRTRQAVETREPERRPLWTSCCGVSWIPQRVLADGRIVPQWSDEADQTPAYTECPVCHRGWLR